MNATTDRSGWAKRLKAVAVVVAMLLVASLVFYASTDREPSYNGRTLTSYLAGPWEQIDNSLDNPHFGPNLKAIRAIGTNGIPTLLRLIQANDPPWKSNLIAFLNRQKILPIHPRDAATRRGLGALGLFELEKDARPALPMLLRLTSDPTPEIRDTALSCVVHLEHNKETLVPVLTRLFHDSNQRVRKDAAYHLSMFYKAEAEALGVFEIFPEYRAIAIQSSTNSPWGNTDVLQSSH